MQELMVFEGKQVEVFELNGEVLFNPYHVGACLGLKDSAIRMAISKMNSNQVVKVKNSDVKDIDIRKLNNAGENFLTEPGVYKFVFKSNKAEAETFTDWVADKVLPEIRKKGSYEMPQIKANSERLASVNNAVKILTPLLEKAGCNYKIQLLTAKSLYEKAGVELPVEIKEEQPYFDTVHIARDVGIFSKVGNKPAYNAVCEIIKKINVDQSEYVETWEAKGKWEGTVRKYTQAVIEKIKEWLTENLFPNDIPYTTRKGEVKNYHVIYQNREYMKKEQ